MHTDRSRYPDLHRVGAALRPAPVTALVLAALLVLQPVTTSGHIAAAAADPVTVRLEVTLVDFKDRPVVDAGVTLDRWHGDGEPDATSTSDWIFEAAGRADGQGRLTLEPRVPEAGSAEFLLRVDAPWDQRTRLPERQPVQLTLDADGTVHTDAPGVTAAADGLTVTFDRPNVVIAVEDEEGTPLPDVRVDWFSSHEEQPDDPDNPDNPDNPDDASSWQRQWSAGETDDDGEFTLHVTPEDGRRHRLELHFADAADDLPPLEHRFSVAADGTVDHGDATVVDGTVRLTALLPNLTVNVLTAQGAPVADATVWLEQRPISVRRGGWIGAEPVTQASWGIPAKRTAEDDGARFRFDPPARPDVEVEYRLRVSAPAAPPFEQRFTVRPDGTLSYRPGERLVEGSDGEVTVALWDRELPEDHQDPAWLLRLNEARADAGLHPLVERPDWNRAALRHGWYASRNGAFAHEEDPSRPGHSLEGEWATRTGNLHSAAPRRAEAAIESWLRSPGHAGWMLDPRVTEVGYGGFVDPGGGAISVLPIVGSLVTSDREPPPRVSYPQPDGTLHVAERGMQLLYLWRDDLLEQPKDADGLPRGLEARARVNGAPVEVEASYGTRWRNVILTLAEPLLPGDDVEVTVLIDGEPYDAWSFTTAAAAPLPPPDLPETFADVGPDASHYHGVEAVAGADIAGGFGDGTFRPSQPVTRAQMATFLVNALWLRDADLTPAPLPEDVAGDDVHAEAVALLLASGIAGGFPDGTYRPSQPVTRAQMATFLAAGLELDTEVELADDAAPSDIAGVHAGSIAAVIDEGVASGFGDGTYRPGAPVTRGQMATFLRRGLLLP